MCAPISSGALSGMTIIINEECVESRFLMADASYMEADPSYPSFAGCGEIGIATRQHDAGTAKLICPDILTSIERRLLQSPWRP